MAEPVIPPAGISSPRLVGRDQEQALLREQLAAALTGRGSLVLIDSEAGIGKTALPEALVTEAAERGALVLTGRCYDLAETPPYGPWAEALARLPAASEDDPLPAPLGDGEAAASQAALFARVQAVLAARAARQPLVFLLEDLHWADPASLELLRTLARHLARLPVLVLVTYRDDELARRHPLAQLLPVLVREARATRLDLRVLPDEAVRDLVRGRYGPTPRAQPSRPRRRSRRRGATGAPGPRTACRSRVLPLDQPPFLHPRARRGQSATVLR